MKKNIFAFSILCASAAMAHEDSKAVVSCGSAVGGKRLIGGNQYTLYKSSKKVDEKLVDSYRLQVSNASLGPNADVPRFQSFDGIVSVVVDRPGTSVSLTSDLGVNGFIVAHLRAEEKSFIDVNVTGGEMNTSGVVELICGSM